MFRANTLLCAVCGCTAAFHGGPTGGDAVQSGPHEGSLLHQQGGLPDDHTRGGKPPKKQRPHRVQQVEQ